MKYLATALWLLYLAVLSAGLFLPDPFIMAGTEHDVLRTLYFDKVDPVGHVLAFLPLGFLSCASPWPRRGAVRLGLSVAYALASEPLQAFFPPRTPQLSDLIEDLVGLALGATCWWVLTRLRRAKPATAREQPEW